MKPKLSSLISDFLKLKEIDSRAFFKFQMTSNPAQINPTFIYKYTLVLQQEDKLLNPQKLYLCFIHFTSAYTSVQSCFTVGKRVVDRKPQTLHLHCSVEGNNLHFSLFKYVTTSHDYECYDLQHFCVSKLV